MMSQYRKISNPETLYPDRSVAMHYTRFWYITAKIDIGGKPHQNMKVAFPIQSPGVPMQSHISTTSTNDYTAGPESHVSMGLTRPSHIDSSACSTKRLPFLGYHYLSTSCRKAFFSKQRPSSKVVVRFRLIPKSRGAVGRKFLR